MRALALPLSLALALAVPMAAQQAKFIKVDIISKSGRLGHGHHAQKEAKKDGPTEIHMRLPISLAKGVLEMAGDSDIKINGENKKGLKPDALIKMLEGSKAGDLLLEITTNDGDLVKVVIE
ncbi:MAG: hypothetical protein WAT51_06200 [Holophaga sp.]